MERLPGQCLQNLVDSIEISLFHRLRYSVSLFINILATYFCFSIMSDIVYGLSYCHQNKLLHLDLKPQNVLITLTQQNDIRPYVCKLCDFGCSVKMLTDRNVHPGVSEFLQFAT